MFVDIVVLIIIFGMLFYRLGYEECNPFLGVLLFDQPNFMVKGENLFPVYLIG